MRISERRKDKQTLMQYIIAEEVDDNEGENTKANPKTMVFDRLQPPTLRQHPSVFRGLERVKSRNPMSFIG